MLRCQKEEIAKREELIALQKDSPVIFAVLKRYYCISDGKSRTGYCSAENDSRGEKMS
jgi:hypothetical protein